MEVPSKGLGEVKRSHPKSKENLEILRRVFLVSAEIWGLINGLRKIQIDEDSKSEIEKLHKTFSKRFYKSPRGSSDNFDLNKFDLRLLNQLEVKATEFRGRPQLIQETKILERYLKKQTAQNK